jgi:large subunit ribosomal protein L31
MKKDIHPAYNAHITITCSCGATFETGGTKDGMTIETCSQCHPIYTGKQKIVDSTGRVDRFKKLAAKTKEVQSTKKSTKKAPKKKTEKKTRIAA